MTENEKQVVSWVLENVIDNINKEAGFDGSPAYNTDDSLLFSFSGQDYQALKRAKNKISI